MWWCGTIVVLLQLGVCALGQDEDVQTYPVMTLNSFGGNGGGAPCKFPFVYKGDSFESCTTRGTSGNNRNRLWCGTTDSYDISRQWGWCDRSFPAVRTTNGNAGGSHCAENGFTYLGTFYQNCTIRNYNSRWPWCATSGNYDRDRRWGRCRRYPVVYTDDTGPVAEGNNQKCAFPFYYRNKWHYGCINWRGRGWCSTTPRYRRDRQWGYCILKTVQAGSDCVAQWQNFTNSLSYGGVLDSSVTGQDDTDECLRLCLSNQQCVAVDFDRNPASTQRCFIHTSAENVQQNFTTGRNNVDQYRLIERCADTAPTPEDNEVTVTGGNSLPGDKCVFPSGFDGYQLTTCTSQGWPLPWCPVTDNYRRDGRWGECTNIETE